MSQVSDKLDEIYDNLNNIEEGMAESGAWQGHGVEECVKWCKEMLAETDKWLNELGVFLTDYGRGSQDDLEDISSQVDVRRAAVLRWEKEKFGVQDWSDQTLAMELGDLVDLPLSDHALSVDWVVDRLNPHEITMRRFRDYWHVGLCGCACDFGCGLVAG